MIATSRVRGGLDEVRSCIPRGSVGMILGESGAGKSTLLNTLLGTEALETSEVRERDDAGRHTTVARIMVTLPEPCGVIADCPGLRSLPLVGHERGSHEHFPRSSMLHIPVDSMTAPMCTSRDAVCCRAWKMGDRARARGRVFGARFRDARECAELGPRYPPLTRDFLTRERKTTT